MQWCSGLVSMATVETAKRKPIKFVEDTKLKQMTNAMNRKQYLQGSYWLLM